MEGGTSSHHTMCYSGTVMQQGQPPCSLPVSYRTKMMVKHTVSHCKLQQTPSYDSPLMKNKQTNKPNKYKVMCRLFAELWLLGLHRHLEGGGKVVGGWVSGYISWRHPNASGQVGGSVHLTLLSTHMMWPHQCKSFFIFVPHNIDCIARCRLPKLLNFNQKNQMSQKS